MANLGPGKLNRIYEEVDINGPIPKTRPKPACQGSMEHRKALSLADCRFTEPAARRTFRSLPDLRKPNGKRRAAWDSMLACLQVTRCFDKWRKNATRLHCVPVFVFWFKYKWQTIANSKLQASKPMPALTPNMGQASARSSSDSCWELLG